MLDYAGFADKIGGVMFPEEGDERTSLLCRLVAVAVNSLCLPLYLHIIDDTRVITRPTPRFVITFQLLVDPTIKMDAKMQCKYELLKGLSREVTKGC